MLGCFKEIAFVRYVSNVIDVANVMDVVVGAGSWAQVSDRRSRSVMQRKSAFHRVLGLAPSARCGGRGCGWDLCV